MLSKMIVKVLIHKGIRFSLSTSIRFAFLSNAVECMLTINSAIVSVRRGTG